MRLADYSAWSHRVGYDSGTEHLPDKHRGVVKHISQNGKNQWIWVKVQWASLHYT